MQYLTFMIWYLFPFDIDISYCIEYQYLSLSLTSVNLQ